MAGFVELISHAAIRIFDEGITNEVAMNTVNRTLPFYVMSYIQQGGALLRANGKEYVLGPHSVIIIPPGTTHDHIKIGGEPTLFMWWHFDFMIFDVIDVLKIMRLPMVFQLQENQAFEDAFSRYAHTIAQPVSLKNAMMKKAHTAEIMARLFEAAEEDYHLRQEGAVPEAFMEMFSTIISGTNTELSLEALARRYNLHPTYISNKFKSFFGISPIQLARKVQIQRAIDLLYHQGKPVGEVALALGFKDVSTFTRFFTAQTGTAPSRISKTSAVLGITPKYY